MSAEDAVSRIGVEPSAETATAAGRPSTSNLLRSSPLRIGFGGTIGVLLALALGAAVVQVSFTLTLVFLAVFISLGLYPLVTRLERRGLPKWGAISVVLLAFVAVVTVIILLVVPVVIDQAILLIDTLPRYVTDIENQSWFVDLDERFNGYPFLLLEWTRSSSADPNLWIAIGTGGLRIGAGIINGISSIVLVTVITLYFVASLDAMKNALYDLVPGSKRAQFEEIAEEIFESIGKYLSGQVVLASINAVVSFIVLAAVGVPYAGILAFVALFVTLIPMIGSIISTVLMTAVTLLVSPPAAIIVAAVMLIYMQVEAYVLTPKIVGKAVSIPGSLVLIGAVIGATLLGLLGALVASPIAASILLILKKIVVPHQRQR